MKEFCLILMIIGGIGSVFTLFSMNVTEPKRNIDTRSVSYPEVGTVRELRIR